MSAISVIRKKRGRPATGIGKPVGLRLYRDEEAALEALIATLPDPKPSRPELIRQIITDHLRERGYLPPAK